MLAMHIEKRVVVLVLVFVAQSVTFERRQIED